MAWVKLHLTTPNMSNASVAKHGGGDHEVTHAQTLLAHNRFKDFRPGHIDGVYGEHSHNATIRAKYWLGYPRKEINGAFGQNLLDFLNGKKLTAAMKVRRARRLAIYRARKRKRNSIAAERARAHNYARSQIGVKESPFGSNDQKYGAWYGANGVPWCAIFRTYSWVVGGGYNHGHSWIRSHQWSFVPFIVSAARLRQHGLELISGKYVEVGDTVCYDWPPKDGVSDHVESFDGWIIRGESFWAIGGNTGPANFSNGGEVARSERFVSQVSAFVRVIA